MTPPGWRMRWQGTTGVEDEMAGVGDNADRFTAWGICHARGNETDTSNGTWVWKVLRIWDTIGIILI